MNFISGGTGILGSRLLLDLLLKGEKVRALKRKSSNLKTVEKVFQFYHPQENLFSKIEWVNGDINDVDSLEKAMHGCDYVYHCAATVSFFKKDKEQLFKINVEGTFNMVNIALKLGIKKFCHVSSTASLGESIEKGKITEKELWKKSEGRSNYAVSKKLAEMEVWRGIEQGLNAVIVNPSVIIGPGVENKSSASLFDKVNKGLRFYTKGVNGFVDVRDVSRVMIELMRSKISKERFLVIGENLTFQEIFNCIAESLNKPKPSVEAKKWMAAILWRVETVRSFLFNVDPLVTKETSASAFKHSYYSNEKIKQRLNFEFTPIKKSIAELGVFYAKTI